ncbi:MAG: hypothetical protein HY619_07300 [Thaumarchaeota archaeon]|nr:hypothetical protein [Nitrososphaerota archaeon]
MKVKEYPDGTILLEGKALEGAREAYQEERIIEAFALLHAFIEWEMANLYEQNHLSNGGSLIELREKGIMQKYRFSWLRKQLRDTQLLKPVEDQRLGKWYDLRNKIIHRLVAYSYHNYDWNRVTREQVEDGFREGEALAEMLRRRALGF